MGLLSAKRIVIRWSAERIVIRRGAKRIVVRWSAERIVVRWSAKRIVVCWGAECTLLWLSKGIRLCSETALLLSPESALLAAWHGSFCFKIRTLFESWEGNSASQQQVVVPVKVRINVLLWLEHRVPELDQT